MSTKQELLDMMNGAINNVGDNIRKRRADGQKIVGILPVYVPEELVYAAGMFPVGCWGGSASISKAAKYFPPFACSIMQIVMEFAENGVYKDLSAFLLSAPCDTLKCVNQDLLTACPDQKVIPIIYPQNSKPEYSVRYTMSELAKVKAKLEEIAGEKITAEKINDAIQVYNENRLAMQEFYQVAAEKPGCITARQRHIVAKSSYFMDKAEHARAVRELSQRLREEPAAAWTGRKVMLAGIISEPAGVLDILDELNMYVVADELAHEARQFRTLVPEGIDQMERLARHYQNMDSCSLIYDPHKSRADLIAEHAKRNGADGVIYYQMKFCDPEEFDYPWIKKACDEVNIPILNIEVDQTTLSLEQVRTRMQAFDETFS